MPRRRRRTLRRTYASGGVGVGFLFFSVLFFSGLFSCGFFSVFLLSSTPYACTTSTCRRTSFLQFLNSFAAPFRWPSLFRRDLRARFPQAALHLLADALLRQIRYPDASARAEEILKVESCSSSSSPFSFFHSSSSPSFGLFHAGSSLAASLRCPVHCTDALDSLPALRLTLASHCCSSLLSLCWTR
jgi:hypothetical protein